MPPNAIPKQVELQDWVIDLCYKENDSGPNRIRLWGAVVPHHPLNHMWHSTAIVERISSHNVRTRNGTEVKLLGNFLKKTAENCGMSATAAGQFTNGFPVNWKQIIVDGYERPQLAEDLSQRPFTTRESSQITMPPTAIPKQVELQDWVIDLCYKQNDSDPNRIRIWGTIDPPHPLEYMWHCTSIVERISSHHVRTRTGTEVKLLGNFLKKTTKNCGMSATAVEQFTNGFPENWKQIIVDAYQSPRLAKDLSQRPLTTRESSREHDALNEERRLSTKPSKISRKASSTRSTRARGATAGASNASRKVRTTRFTRSKAATAANQIGPAKVSEDTTASHTPPPQEKDQIVRVSRKSAKPSAKSTLAVTRALPGAKSVVPPSNPPWNLRLTRGRTKSIAEPLNSPPRNYRRGRKPQPAKPALKPAKTISKPAPTRSGRTVQSKATKPVVKPSGRGRKQPNRSTAATKPATRQNERKSKSSPPQKTVAGRTRGAKSSTRTRSTTVVETTSSTGQETTGKRKVQVTTSKKTAGQNAISKKRSNVAKETTAANGKGTTAAITRRKTRSQTSISRMSSSANNTPVSKKVTREKKVQGTPAPRMSTQGSRSGVTILSASKMKSIPSHATPRKRKAPADERQVTEKKRAKKSRPPTPAKATAKRIMPQPPTQEEESLADKLQAAREAKKAKRSRRVAFADVKTEYRLPGAASSSDVPKTPKVSGARGKQPVVTPANSGHTTRGQAKGWTREQLNAYQRASNSVAADSEDYWENIAAIVNGKNGEECRQLWESTWSSPKVVRKKKAKRVETPELVGELQRAGKSARGRETVKFRSRARMLADRVADGLSYEALEPALGSGTKVVVTPKSVKGVETGTPGTEVRERLKALENASRTETPDILKRGRTIGLEEADRYAAGFWKRVTGGGSNAGNSRKGGDDDNGEENVEEEKRSKQVERVGMEGNESDYSDEEAFLRNENDYSDEEPFF